MLVEDIMTTELVTVDVSASLRDVVGQLVEHGVGSVVVLDDGIPTGLVTESDVLAAVYEAESALGDVPVRPLCAGSLVTTSPDRSVESVADRMMSEGVKKLPVVEGVDLVGIVTLTDVVLHLSEFRSEAARLAARHYDWEQD